MSTKTKSVKKKQRQQKSNYIRNQDNKSKMKTFIKFVIISTLSLSTFFQNSFSNEKIN